MGARLMTVVAEGHRQRVYLAPTRDQEAAAIIDRVTDPPAGDLPTNPRDFKTPNYGMVHWADLFTNRQLLALTTFSDLVSGARDQVLRDARAKGLPAGDRLEQGGVDAEAYADAVATYLGLAVSRMTDYQSALAVWSSHPKNELIQPGSTV